MLQVEGKEAHVGVLECHLCVCVSVSVSVSVSVCVCVCVFVCLFVRARACAHACMCALAYGRALMRASRRESLMGSRANPLCRLPAFDVEIH